MTAPALAPQQTPTDRERMGHLVCTCSPDIALCGYRYPNSRLVWIDKDKTGCVVCRDLLDSGCSRCGVSA